MELNKRFELVKRNTEEIVQDDELKIILKKKNPLAYIGYAPTGKLHVGHIFPIIKIGDFLKAGFSVKFLIADLHAFLDDMKSPWNLLKLRAEYYKETVSALLESLNISTKNLEFVRGSDFQMDKKYQMDLFHLMGEVTLKRARRAAAEVVRFKEDPKLGGYVYPLMQILDPVYLKADVCFSGIDQRGIYMLGREILPKLKYDKPTCVFTPLLPGLKGGKMSASDDSSKIGLLDSEKEIDEKINKSYCKAGEIKDNGILLFVKNVLFMVNDKFIVKRDEKFGGDLTYKDYIKLENDFRNGKLHPLDLKKAVSKEINNIIKPVRKKLENKKDLVKKAYPDK